MQKQQTIGGYLIDQLLKRGADHVFGVPGDYVLTFFKQLEESPLKIINTTDEQGAGFAADAYARIRGIGVACVTYGVGGLKVVNAAAQAFSEKSPLVIITGAPGVKERVRHTLLHHKVRNYDTQIRIFEHVTVASTVLDNPKTAFAEIDCVLDAAQRFSQPVFIEIARDMVLAKGHPPRHKTSPRPASDPAALREALAEAIPRINRSKKPVFIMGNEIHRFGLQKAALQLIDKSNIPFVTLLQSKSVLPETHPLYMGVYEGGVGLRDVRAYVEKSDCLILLGAELNDINLGIFTAKLDTRVSIFAAREKTSIAHHHFSGIQLEDFINKLKLPLKKRIRPKTPRPPMDVTFAPKTNRKITVKRLFECLNALLEDHHIVVSDTGDALFGASDLYIHRSAEFMACAYYASLGFSVPAAIGVQLANPKQRPIVLVGDGAFQMTGMELSTAARFNLNPIVILLNNGGYGTERPIQEGLFNDLQNWKYHLIPEVLGAGHGFDVHTEEEFLDAMTAVGKLKQLSLIEVHLAQGDFSPALMRLTGEMRRRMGK